MKKALFINIALLFILIYVCTSYNHRQTIVNTERPIDMGHSLQTLREKIDSGAFSGETLLWR